MKSLTHPTNVPLSPRTSGQSLPVLLSHPRQYAFMSLWGRSFLTCHDGGVIVSSASLRRFNPVERTETGISFVNWGGEKREYACLVLNLSLSFFPFLIDSLSFPCVSPLSFSSLFYRPADFYHEPSSTPNEGVTLLKGSKVLPISLVLNAWMDEDAPYVHGLFLSFFSVVLI